MICTVWCPYCHQRAELVTGRIVYENRPELAENKYWLCSPCNAYVGCHNNSRSNKPYGNLANAELRWHRVEAHKAFDTMWKNREMTRTDGYTWLSAMLDIPSTKCHIAMFDVETCRKVLAIC